MKIIGKFERDENFTTVYCDNTVYTIARATGEVGSISVGDNVGGHILTQEKYDSWKARCNKEGIFEIPE